MMKLPLNVDFTGKVVVVTGAGGVLCSLFAKAIARRLGGGGHSRAAGCELLGNLENAKNAILAEVEAELDAPQEEA